MSPVSAEPHTHVHACSSHPNAVRMYSRAKDDEDTRSYDTAHPLLRGTRAYGGRHAATNSCVHYVNIMLKLIHSGASPESTHMQALALAVPSAYHT